MCAIFKADYMSSNDAGAIITLYRPLLLGNGVNHTHGISKNDQVPIEQYGPVICRCASLRDGEEHVFPNSAGVMVDLKPCGFVSSDVNSTEDVHPGLVNQYDWLSDGYFHWW